MATDAQIEAFKQRWLGSEAAERSNSQLFLTELTDLMGVPHPSAAINDPSRDDYVFERRVRLAQPGGEKAGWIDLYKRGCFVFESKQGANEHKKGGFAKRDTPSWENEMEKARGQAKGYAQTLAEVPPFVVVCDVGHVFEIHACFDGSAHWTAFPAPPANRIYLRDLDHGKLETLRRIWTEPLSLDPSRHQATVSREVAEALAELARSLEGEGHTPEAVARFLMRCIFTMFAEDIGLFPDKRKLFQQYLEQFWVKNPAGFPAGVQTFWSVMNTGGTLLTGDVLRRFNGGLFADSSALPLSPFGLEMLLAAAKHDWSQVEPAIFGTLLERALDPKERHRLGAHYTPRAYVERLVRPTIEEPLRADWLVVQTEARRLREAGKLKDAAKVLQQFHAKLCQVRVLDPACGSGNFLYVALDLMKRLEAEVREELWRLGDQNELLEFDGTTVRPSQFLGIEKKRWAKEIAELVLWIGYLRWHFRAKGERGEVPVPEPVLENYENIECRDAVLDWDGAPHEKMVVDERGRPVTRWDGETTKADPITGMQVPDESATVVLYEYPNARPAKWPDADFIVGNPPFVGNKRMRLVLGDGYVEALRSTHKDVPESADYVMYWWDEAARSVLARRSRRFGLITTNSVTQTFNRRVIERHLADGLGLTFAIPDHPWVDSETGAAVRIAMTAAAPGVTDGVLLSVASEAEAKDDGAAEVTLTSASGPIAPSLQLAARLGDLRLLRSNQDLAYRGITLVGSGFNVPDASPLRRSPLGVTLVGAKAILGSKPTKFVIDASSLSEHELRTQFPMEYQHLFDHVKKFRDAQERPSYRARWWIFAEARPEFRRAARDLKRYIATIETARRRWFTFLDADTLPEQTLIAIALADGYELGVLSSAPHVIFASETSMSKNGAGNDPRYNIAECFGRFPFPDATDAQKARIRDLAERLDAHRKRQLAAHPKLTITGMYNVLEKLRSGADLDDKDRAIHEDGLVSLLKQIHDELDAAVLDAYGWPTTLTDDELLERLVALNAERAAEEARGLVRWLRPDFQAPKAAKPTQVEVPGIETAAPVAPTTTKAAAWPRPFAERVTLVRDVVLASSADTSFSAAEVAARFKRAKQTDVADILESFVALGYLVGFEAPDGTRRWARPARAA